LVYDKNHQLLLYNLAVIISIDKASSVIIIIYNIGN